MPSIPAPETTAEILLGDDDTAATAIEAYRQTGAIIVRGLIGPEWMASLHEGFAELAQSAWTPFVKDQPPLEKRTSAQRAGMWQEQESFRDFLFHSPIARAAATVMGSSTAQLYEDILITRVPGAEAKSAWHQDEPTWPISGRQLSSVWFSLEPVDVQTGAMRFVKGSQLGPMYHPEYVAPGSAGDDDRFWTGGSLPDVEARPDLFPVVQTDAEPGDVVIFHPRALHTAYGSSQDYARRTFTIRFMGDDVRWLPKKRIYHKWMHELGLNEGDKIVTPRLPIVWNASDVRV